MGSRHPLDLEELWHTWVVPRSSGPPLKPNFSADQWRFFGAVAEIRERMGNDVEVDLEDPTAPTINFALQNDEYWLRIECAEDPCSSTDDQLLQPPVLQGAFIAGFQYEWNRGRRLADLVEQYYSYAVTMDDAIGYIKEIHSHDVSLIGYDLAEGGEGEEDSDTSQGAETVETTGVCLRVRIKVAGGVGEVRLLVAVDDPLAYPRAIKIVDKGELLNELKADNWQTGETLVANLVDLFSDLVAQGEVAEAYEKSAMKEGEEDDDDWDAEWW